LFGGIHRGFAPPRVKDAISNDGTVYNLDPELSWNSELGIRSQIGQVINFELTAFNMDFSNQIIPVSESAGGIGSGVVNGGSVRSFYNEDRFKESGTEEVNIKDNRTPYSPQLLIASALTFEMPIGLQARINGNYTGDQFTDELNTITPSNNGRIGQLPSYYLMDASILYHFKKQNINISFSIKNLTNERYISTRRPQGIRVGLPRYISFGIDKKW